MEGCGPIPFQGFQTFIRITSRVPGTCLKNAWFSLLNIKQVTELKSRLGCMKNKVSETTKSPHFLSTEGCLSSWANSCRMTTAKQGFIDNLILQNAVMNMGRSFPS